MTWLTGLCAVVGVSIVSVAIVRAAVRARRRWRDRPDPAWKATGLKFTTARDYEYERAKANVAKAKKQTPRGRAIKAPKPPRVKQPAPVKRIDEYRKVGR